MLQAQRWMLGTGPGIFPFFSRFPQVSRWGSRAPSCFDLGVGGELFFSKKVEEKISCWIFALLLLSPMLLCGGVRREREKKKKKIFFFFFKGTRYFSWNWMLETLHHRGRLAWDLLVCTSGWISSNSAEVTGSALAGSCPPRTWGQPYRSKLFSRTSHGPSPGQVAEWV